MKYLIVGVDPGTTTAIAILDLKGNLLNIYSSKDCGVSQALQHILPYGRVSLIACDVNPEPHFVRKMASSIGCNIYCPVESFSVAEKIKITRDYEVENSHQRDALASGLSAYRKYKNKFSKIETQNLGQKVKHNVLMGRAINSKEPANAKDKQSSVKIRRKPASDVNLARLQKIIARVDDLTNELHSKDKKISALEDSVRVEKSKFRCQLKRDTEIQRLDNIIFCLQGRVQELESELRQSSRYKRIWDKIGSAEIKAVGVFPNVFEGMSYIRGSIKNVDKSMLNDLTFAFSDSQSTKGRLKKAGVMVASTSYLKQFRGCYWVACADIERLRKENKISLNTLVDDYRASRPAP